MELETQIECPFMATAGEVVELPGGERIVFVKTAAETGGELLEMEAHYTPGRRPPPEHYHPHQEERFTGITGKMAARVGGTERTLAPGDELVVAPGVNHTFGTREPRRRGFTGKFAPHLRPRSSSSSLARPARCSRQR